MAEHTLKCWPSFFADVADGSKTFEVRRNDRNFQVGDTLRLLEYVPDYDYTGDECSVKVLGVWSDLPGVLPGHVVMRVELCSRVQPEGKS
jgi:hypothetical protein